MIKRKTKQNDSRTGILLSLLIVFLILVGGTCCGLFYAYSFCSNIWHEQCQITNPELDVVISTGKMVHPDVITFHFGLTNGANLATIPLTLMRPCSIHFSASRINLLLIAFPYLQEISGRRYRCFRF